MPQIPFSELPSSARLWIFPAERTLMPDEEETFLARIDAFLDGWTTHGVPLTCARDWRYSRFLLVGVDEAASGCAIDAMTHVLKDVGRDLGVSFLDRAPILYKKGDGVRRSSRAEFKAMVEAGEVDLDTVVFDNSISRLFQLEAGDWQKPAGASWHRRFFFQN
jgi:hypothetical protein